MLHTFKKKYVDEDEQRKTSDLLSEHIRHETERLTTNFSRAAARLQHRNDELQRQHDEAMVASHQHVFEVSRAYREAIGKHAESLQLSVQGTHVLARVRVRVGIRVKVRVRARVNVRVRVWSRVRTCTGGGAGLG